MEGTPKAIEMKGIVRNATKIGVQDGQAEDLINLRFVDGSWRASGNGRQIENMPTGTIYQQLYVHTNIYHHLLGVDNGTLYWFADIADDGVTFTPLAEPVALTTVVGDVWITQAGHLLTVIDGADDFEHFVFKTGEEKYIEVKVDVNGKATDRGIFPFGQVHFNLYSDANDETLVHQKQVDELDLSKGSSTLGSPTYWNGIHDPSEVNLKADGFIDDASATDDKIVSKTYHNIMVELFGEATKENQFTRPFLTVLAYRLYDGSFLYSSNPVLLFPRNLSTSQTAYVHAMYPQGSATPSDPQIKTVPSRDVCTLFENSISFANDNVDSPYDYIPYAPGGLLIGKDKDQTGNVICGCFLQSEMDNQSDYVATEQPGVLQRGSKPVYYMLKEHVPVYCNGVSGYCQDDLSSPSTLTYGGRKYRAAVIGSKLCVSIDDYGVIEQNSDIFKSICIFVTPQVDLWSLEADNDEGQTELHLRTLKDSGTHSGDIYATSIMTISYAPKRYDIKKVIEVLLHSQFYLLKEYTKNTIRELKDNPVVDLSDYMSEEILKNIAQQNTLPIEAPARTTYLPKTTYMYNGRLHIANYKSDTFLGYPIDLFQLHNHSVKVQTGGWFPEDSAGQRVLPNLVAFHDGYLQFPREQEAITNYEDLVTAGAPYFLVKVFLESSNGEQVVCRYIPAYDPTTSINGRADFIEDLNPLLTYPDARAKKMIVYYVNDYEPESEQEPIPPLGGYGVYVKKKEFDLKPHPYLNMAYYIDPDLKPIKLSSFDNYIERSPLL